MWHFGMMGAGYHEAARAAEASGAAGRAQARANNAERNLLTVSERLDRLTLTCMAMWELVREQTNLTEGDLLQRVQEIGLRDGVADGKITGKVARCPKCDRVMNPRHKKCLYCGAAKLNVGAFDNTL